MWYGTTRLRYRGLVTVRSSSGADGKDGTEIVNGTDWLRHGTVAVRKSVNATERVAVRKSANSAEVGCGTDRTVAVRTGRKGWGTEDG